MDERNHTRSDVDADAGAESRDDGFTLIELMVVVLVIAILLAIAVPTFIGARERSQDRATQSNLRNALTAAKVLFVDEGSYSNADWDDLDEVEPSLVFTQSNSASDSHDEISVSAAATIWAAAAESDSGACFFIRDEYSTTSTNAGTRYGRSTTIDCEGEEAIKPATVTVRGQFPTA